MNGDDNLICFVQGSFITHCIKNISPLLLSGVKKKKSYRRK